MNKLIPNIRKMALGGDPPKGVKPPVRDTMYISDLKVNKPKLDTSNWEQSSLDSLKLYNAYQFQKNNTIIKVSPQKNLGSVNLKPDSYKPIKDTNASYKILLNNLKNLKDKSDEAMRTGDYSNPVIKKFIKANHPKLGIHSPIDLREMFERQQFGPNKKPEIYKQNKKIIDYYRSIGIPDKDINFYSSPDVFNSKIKPISNYFDGQAISPVYKKPVGVQKKEAIKNPVADSKKLQMETTKVDTIPIVQPITKTPPIPLTKKQYYEVPDANGKITLLTPEQFSRMSSGNKNDLMSKSPIMNKPKYFYEMNSSGKRQLVPENKIREFMQIKNK